MGHTPLQLLLLSVLLLILSVTGARNDDKEILSAHRCLKDQGEVEVTCKNANQKMKIVSVSYAFNPAEDFCNTPLSEDNDCKQISTDLSTQAKEICDGKYTCKVGVVSVSQLQKTQRESLGLNAEDIQTTIGSCSADKLLQQGVYVNVFQVRYECEDYFFCNELSSEVSKVKMATEGFPVKKTTNPTCECAFESADQEELGLKGFVRCNGTVNFKTEETTQDGTTEYVEYKCENQIGNLILPIGGRNNDDPEAGTNSPYRIKLSVDIENSDEESAYSLSLYNVKVGKKTRTKDMPVKIDCTGGSLYIKRSVQLILKIVLPIVCGLLIILIIIYCICKRKRRRGKDWRARHVRLPAGAKRGSMMDMEPIAGIHMSRSPSINSFPPKKSERVDPEGNVDDLGELAAKMHRENEERRRKQLEKRQQGYNPLGLAGAIPSPTRTPPPARTTIHPSRRAQSIGNLRSDRRYGYGDNLDNSMEAKPLAHSKSASQSRASVRSLKRRAPQPTGPPQAPTSDTLTSRSARPSYASSTPSIHRGRPRQNSQTTLCTPQPHIYNQPHMRDSPYATPYAASPSAGGSLSYSDAHNSDDDMPILRSNNRPPGAPKPAVAPKPMLPPKHNARHYTSNRSTRDIITSDLRDLRDEIDNSD